MSVIQLNVAMDALVLKEHVWRRGKVRLGEMMTSAVLGALDQMEPYLRHLDGLIAALRIMGEADDSIEPVAVSSLARCAQDTLEKIERNWRTAIGAIRKR